MKRIAIHQPHYFPWAGYFNKMNMVDTFVLLDEVQLEKGSYMYRNRILNDKGQIKYLTISADKHGFLEKQYKDLKTVNDDVFLAKHKDELIRSYKKAYYFSEIWNEIEDLFDCHEDSICDYCVRSINRIKGILDIRTNIIMQSGLDYDKTCNKADLVIEICKKVNANEYLSGNGARKYNDETKFINNGINLVYQEYEIPQYKQINSEMFMPGLSILDVLFNCGIDNTKEIVKGVTVY